MGSHAALYNRVRTWPPFGSRDSVTISVTVQELSASSWQTGHKQTILNTIPPSLRYAARVVTTSCVWWKRSLYLQAAAQQAFLSQGCFAIDYDFSTHRCYFFPVNVLLAFTPNVPVMPADPVFAPVPFFVHCIIGAAGPQPSSQGLQPNPSVVHITLCELRSSLRCWYAFPSVRELGLRLGLVLGLSLAAVTATLL